MELQSDGKKVARTQVLTFWEPGYDIFVLWNRPKTSGCQLPYQRPSSSVPTP